MQFIMAGLLRAVMQNAMTLAEVIRHKYVVAEIECRSILRKSLEVSVVA